MQFDVSNLLSVLLGGLLVFAAQWLASRQNAKTEAQKWKEEKLREVRRDIVSFREERTRPVFEALDRVAHRWDVDSVVQLAEAIGYKGEKVDPNSEEYKKQRKEQMQEYFGQMQKDISTASVIHDPNLRKAVRRILWQSTDPELIPDEDTPTLQDTYLSLENWIFNPEVDYNSLQRNGKVSKTTINPRKEASNENRNG